MTEAYGASKVRDAVMKGQDSKLIDRLGRSQPAFDVLSILSGPSKHQGQRSPTRMDRNYRRDDEEDQTVSMRIAVRLREREARRDVSTNKACFSIADKTSRLVGRLGNGREVAHLVYFLADNEQASFIVRRDTLNSTSG